MDEEKKINTSTLDFNSVVFTNFPVWEVNGEIVSYPFMDSVVAKRFADCIPQNCRHAVTVDYSKLPVQELMQKVKDELGIKPQFKSEAELKAAEAKLVEILTGLGLFLGKNDGADDGK